MAERIYLRHILGMGSALYLAYASSAFAQQDPFSSQSVAPLEPTTSLSAPVPTAPAIAPRPKPAPAKPAVVKAPAPLAPPTNPPAAKIATATPAPVAPPSKPTIVPETPTGGKSLLDKIGDLFSSDEPPTQEHQAKPETVNPTASETLKVEQDITSKDPFASKSVAPSQPAGSTLSQDLRPTQNTTPASPQVSEAAKTASTAPPPPTDPAPDFLDRIGNFFKDTFTPENTETQAQENVEPVAKPIATEEQAKDNQPQPTPAPLPEKPIDIRLANAKLGLGLDLKLGQSKDALSPLSKCFDKNRGFVTYCVSETRWPAHLADYFNVSAHIYKGAKGITQFDGNVATRLFTLFNKEGFTDLVKHYENLLGPAPHVFMRKTRTIKMGTLENPTYIWQKHHPEEGLTEIFEIRQIADMRGSIPDLERGSIRVYFEGAREIFTLASDLDFMTIR